MATHETLPIDSEHYQLIWDLVRLAKPSTKLFAELVKPVKDHHQPPTSFNVQRFNFNMRYQKEGESVSALVAVLRRQMEHCKFKDTLDDMLQDRLIYGVRNQRLQQCLLAEPDLTFKKAMLSETLEADERNAKDLQHTTSQV